jgi:hypothetical protein
LSASLTEADVEFIIATVLSHLSSQPSVQQVAAYAV